MAPPSARNHLLASLSPPDAESLSRDLEPIELPFRFQLQQPHRAIEHVYFPDDGIVSVVAAGAPGQQIEVGIIGRDGLSGHPLLLGANRSPNAAYMQVAGHGRRIRADKLRAALQRSEAMRELLLRFVQAFIVQASHTALANGRSKIESRLARWLVMAHDRLESDRIALTHELLAVMLGVRRPGVTVTLQKFESAGLIETRRSAIIITNRPELEKLADGVYGVPEAELERLTGWQPLHRRAP